MLVRKSFVFYWEGGGGGVCAEREFRQEGSRKQT